jgi:hypothetical protein
MLTGLGMTADTDVTSLSDGADGERGAMIAASMDGSAPANARSPHGADLMLHAPTAIVNGTFEADHGSMSRRRRSFQMAA